MYLHHLVLSKKLLYTLCEIGILNLLIKLRKRDKMQGLPSVGKEVKLLSAGIFIIVFPEFK